MITVLLPGILSSVQDLGRLNFASIGVPVSGAMDTFSAGLVNQILGNRKTAAVLEITFGGCKLQFESETYICISGADFSVTLNTSLVRMHQPIKVKKGDVLSFGKQKLGVRTYIGVSGGIQSEKVLGSRSYYHHITENNKLYKGQKLKVGLNKNQVSNASASLHIDDQLFSSKVLVCFKGPEFDRLSTKQKAVLQQQTFTISKDNSRMGYQMVEKIANDFSSMLTSAVLPGTVQLTPSGKLIILMKDAQVTGGYPRVLQLSESSINSLAQKTTNQSFKFLIKQVF